MTLPIPLLLNVQNNSLHPFVSSLTKAVFWNDHYLLDYPNISTLNLGYIINMDIYQELFQILQSYALDHSSSNGMGLDVVWLEDLPLCFFCHTGKWCTSIINQQRFLFFNQTHKQHRPPTPPPPKKIIIKPNLTQKHPHYHICKCPIIYNHKLQNSSSEMYPKR